MKCCWLFSRQVKSGRISHKMTSSARNGGVASVGDDGVLITCLGELAVPVHVSGVDGVTVHIALMAVSGVIPGDSAP